MTEAEAATASSKELGDQHPSQASSLTPAVKTLKVAAEPTLAPGAQKVSADQVAKPFRQEIKDVVAQMPGGVGPKLVGFLANGDPAAKQYAEWTGRAFTSDKLRFELREVDETRLEDELEAANADPEVHGIMIYYPVFGQRPSFHGGSFDDYLRDTVSAYKDVEGLSHYYRRALYKNERYVDTECTRKCVLPCTPLAVIKALEFLDVYDNALPVGERMTGKKVAVVNRSEVVGRPLAAMLANDGAEVYSIDIDSVYIFKRSNGRGQLEIPPKGTTAETALRQADIVILGVPSPNYTLPVAWVKEGAVVINVAFHKNVNEKELLAERPGVRYLSQVGKITVAMLERNLLRLYENFTKETSAGKSGHPSIVS